MAIEAMTADDVHDRQMGSDVVDMAVRAPASWMSDVSAPWLDCPSVSRCVKSCSSLLPKLGSLGHPKPCKGSRQGWEGQHHPHLCPLQVPKILRCIYKNVEQIRTEPARRSLDSLLLLLIRWSPREVVRTLLDISPACDRYRP